MAKPTNNSKLRVSLPWRGLIWQLFIIAIMPLTALVLVIAFGSLTAHQRAMRALVGERDERAVKTAATALEEQLKHRESAMRSLAQLAENSSSSELAEVLSASDYLLADFDTGLAIFNLDGSLASAIGDHEFWKSVAGQIDPVIQNLLENNDSPTIISTTFIHPIIDEKMVLILAISPSRNRIAAGASSASR